MDGRTDARRTTDYDISSLAYGQWSLKKQNARVNFFSFSPQILLFTFKEKFDILRPFEFAICKCFPKCKGLKFFL